MFVAFGRLIDVSALHPANALLPMVVAFGRLIDASALQTPNAAVPMSVAFGRLIDVSAVQHQNASSPMPVAFGITKVIRRVPVSMALSAFLRPLRSFSSVIASVTTEVALSGYGVDAWYDQVCSPTRAT